MDNVILLTIDGTQYEYSVKDFQALTEGELSAPENILRHILKLQKGHFDRLALEMQSLRKQLAEAKQGEEGGGKRNKEKGPRRAG